MEQLSHDVFDIKPLKSKSDHHLSYDTATESVNNPLVPHLGSKVRRFK